MASCRSETVAGFNKYINDVKKTSGMKNAIVSFEQFDSNGMDVIHDKIDLAHVQDMEQFEPRGGTPLYDSMAKLINKCHPDSKGKDVVFITLSDGEENASREYDLTGLKALIKAQEASGWSFVFIGVGLDAYKAGSRVFAGTQSCSNVAQSSHADTAKQYTAMAKGTGNFLRQKMRAGGQSVVATSYFAGTELGQKPDDEKDDQ